MWIWICLVDFLNVWSWRITHQHEVLVLFTSPKKNPRSPTRLCIDSPVLNESFRSSLKFANATAETSSPAPIPQVTRMTIPRRLLFGIYRFYRLATLTIGPHQAFFPIRLSSCFTQGVSCSSSEGTLLIVGLTYQLQWLTPECLLILRRYQPRVLINKRLSIDGAYQQLVDTR